MVWLWVPSNGLFSVAPEAIQQPGGGGGVPTQPPPHRRHNNDAPVTTTILPAHHFVLEIRTVSSSPSTSTTTTPPTTSSSEYIMCDGASWAPASLYPYTVLGHTHPAAAAGALHSNNKQSGSGTASTCLCLMEEGGSVGNGGGGRNKNESGLTSSANRSGLKINPATRMTESRLKSWVQQSEWITLVLECGIEEKPKGNSGREEASTVLSQQEASLLNPHSTQASSGRCFAPPSLVSGFTQQSTITTRTTMYLYIPRVDVSMLLKRSFRVTLDPISRDDVEALVQENSGKSTCTATNPLPTASSHLIQRRNTAAHCPSSSHNHEEDEKGGVENHNRHQLLHPALMLRDPQSSIKASVLGTAVVAGSFLAVPDGGEMYYFRVAGVEVKKLKSEGGAFEPTSQLAHIQPSTVIRLNLSSRYHKASSPSGATACSSIGSDASTSTTSLKNSVVGLDAQRQQCTQRIRRALFDSAATAASSEAVDNVFTPTTNAAAILFAGPPGCGKHTLLNDALENSYMTQPTNVSIVDTIHVDWGLAVSSSATAAPIPSTTMNKALRSAGCSGDASADRIADTLLISATSTSRLATLQHGQVPIIACVLHIAFADQEFPPDDPKLTRMNLDRLYRGTEIIEGALREAVGRCVKRGTSSWPTPAASSTNPSSPTTPLSSNSNMNEQEYSDEPLLGVAFIIAGFSSSVRAVHQLATSSLFQHGIIPAATAVSSSASVCRASGVCEVPLPGLSQRELLIAKPFVSSLLTSSPHLPSPTPSSSPFLVVNSSSGCTSTASTQYMNALLVQRLGVYCSKASARYLMGVSGKDCVRVGTFVLEYLRQAKLDNVYTDASSLNFGSRLRAVFNIQAGSIGIAANDVINTVMTSSPHILQLSHAAQADAYLAMHLLVVSPEEITTVISTADSSSSSVATHLGEPICASVAPLLAKLIRTPGLLAGGALSSGGGLPDENSTAGTSWDDIGGLVEVKERLRQALIRPRLHPEAYKRFGITPPKGILLYGPPGCAKTTLVKALCNEGLYSFIYVDCASVLSSYVGESEQFLREVFAKGRAQAPCIVFFDEVEGVSSNRSSGSGGGDSARLLSTLLIEIDGFATEGGGDEAGSSDAHVCFVGATNLPHLVDPALLRPGRFDYLVHVPLPTASERYSILQSILQRGHRRQHTSSSSSSSSSVHGSEVPTTIPQFQHNESENNILEIGEEEQRLEIALQQYADCVLDPSAHNFFESSPTANGGGTHENGNGTTITPPSSNAIRGLPVQFEDLELLANQKSLAVKALCSSSLSEQEIAYTHLKAVVVRACAADTLFSLCANATEGFSGADLTSLVKEAAAIRQRVAAAVAPSVGSSTLPPPSSTTTTYYQHITLRDLETAALEVSPVDFDTAALTVFMETH